MHNRGSTVYEGWTCLNTTFSYNNKYIINQILGFTEACYSSLNPDCLSPKGTKDYFMLFATQRNLA